MVGQQGGLTAARAPINPEGPVTIEHCWRAFLDCEWTLLDQLIRQLSSSTRTDESEYFPLFSLIHLSRFFRPVASQQALSLSRRAYSLSRQPAQIFTDFRSHSVTRNALRLSLQPNPVQGAFERWKCLVLAMMGQLMPCDPGISAGGLMLWDSKQTLTW